MNKKYMNKLHDGHLQREVTSSIEALCELAISADRSLKLKVNRRKREAYGMLSLLSKKVCGWRDHVMQPVGGMQPEVCHITWHTLSRPSVAPAMFGY